MARQHFVFGKKAINHLVNGVLRAIVAVVLNGIRAMVNGVLYAMIAILNAVPA